MKAHLTVGLALALSSGCRERPTPATTGRAVPGRASGASDGSGAGPTTGLDGGAANANAKLDEVVRQSLDAYTAVRPTAATWLALHGADDRLDDESAATRAREAARLRRLLDAIDGTSPDALDAEHRIDRDLLGRHARLALYDLLDARPYERSPVHYVDVLSAGLYELLDNDFAPLGDRLRNVNGRLGHARALFDDARSNLKSPPELLTRRAVELTQGTRAFVAEVLPRVVAAQNDERLSAEFRAAQADALRALDDYAGFLQRDLQPRSKGDLAVGRAHLVDRLRLREALDTPSDALYAQLVAASERELKAAQKRFEEAARLAFPGKTPAETLRALEDDHPAADQLEATVRATLTSLWQFTTAQRLLDLPAQPPRVVEMPPYLWGFVRLSLAGPFAATARDELYVDPVNRAWDKKTVEEHLRAFHRAELTMVLVREAVAQLAQMSAARRAPTTMQKLSGDAAFAEGWPRYYAQVALDVGYGVDGGKPDARLRLAQRREALLALGRMVAALRFHGQGARLDDVVELFTDQCSLEEPVARREAERVAADPDVLDEAFGALSIFKLRDDVERERGAAFDLGAFHRELLAHGPLPLGVLRRLLLRQPDPNVL